VATSECLRVDRLTHRLTGAATVPYGDARTERDESTAELEPQGVG